VEGQIFYNRKDEYFSLIKEYLDERIEPYSFISEFIDMEREDSKAVQ
jgi:hypothetical protein